MYIQALENMGLSSAEIRVYLSLLKHGETTSGPVVTDTNMQSSVVHRVLNKLVDKGLASYIVIKSNRHYQAATPKDLVKFLDNKKKELLDVLPQIEAISIGAKERNQVEMYSGKKAIFTMLNTLVEFGKPGDVYCSFSLTAEHGKDDIVRFYRQFNLRRRELKLDVKVLVNNEVRQFYEQNYSADLLKKANVRYSNFTFPQGLIVFLNRVIFLNWGDNPMAVVVQNLDMANQYRKFFLSFYDAESDAY